MQSTILSSGFHLELFVGCLQKNDALKLTWERKADLPVGTSSPQIVKMKNFVFVGGGLRKQSETRAIFQYSVHDNRWTTLCQCPALRQGLVALNGELISVGGKNSQGITNAVYTFRDGRWNDVLPPMPTPRCDTSTVSQNDLIVAAGGLTGITRDGKSLPTQAVEIYIRDRQWYITKPMPIPLAIASTCVIGDTCYMLGGSGSVAKHSLTTQQVSLSSLIEGAVPAASLVQERKAEWTTTEYPLYLSSIVELEGKLIAMGGSYDGVLRYGSKLISSYDFTTDMWVECQGVQLPVPLYRPGVVKLAGNKVMIIGGQSEMKQFSKQVYIGSELPLIRTSYSGHPEKFPRMLHSTTPHLEN